MCWQTGWHHMSQQCCQCCLHGSRGYYFIRAQQATLISVESSGFVRGGSHTSRECYTSELHFNARVASAINA